MLHRLPCAPQVVDADPLNEIQLPVFSRLIRFNLRIIEKKNQLNVSKWFDINICKTSPQMLPEYRNTENCIIQIRKRQLLPRQLHSKACFARHLQGAAGNALVCLHRHGASRSSYGPTSPFCFFSLLPNKRNNVIKLNLIQYANRNISCCNDINL